MARILATGIATLDIINHVDGYPAEDSEVRAQAQTVRRGGNAANLLAVLAQFGHQCHFAGTLGEDPDGQRIERDLHDRGIDLSAARRVAGGHAPTSYILLNRQNGSRSIVHYRDLPEYGLDSFMDLPLAEFDWLHFEGRNCDELDGMLALARSLVVDQPISLEVEKDRPGIDRLFGLADILFFSRAFVLGRGFEDPEVFLAAAREWAPRAVLVLPWGERGAYLCTADGILHEPARPVAEVVDTIGAGDTFIAGFVDARLNGRTLGNALVEACRLAEHKIAQEGFDHLLTSDDGPSASRAGESPVLSLADLPDPGSRELTLVDGHARRKVFLVRSGNKLKAYENRCPHIGAELNWRPDEFLDADGRQIVCAVHGATFRIEDGFCTHGPCAGDALTPVPVVVENGMVRVGGREDPAPSQA
ncbi:MAG: PfkB family carbohydrate kinase [Halothiobacillaceae bacterium]